MPPSVRTYCTGPYYPRFGHYDGGYSGFGASSSVTMVREGYVETRETAVLVTTIYDVATGKPVWVGQTEANPPDSVSKLAEEVTKSTWNNVANSRLVMRRLPGNEITPSDRA